MTTTKYTVLNISKEYDVDRNYIFEIKKRLGINTRHIESAEDYDRIVEAVEKIQYMWSVVTLPTIQRYFEKICINEKYDAFFERRRMMVDKKGEKL